MSAETKAKILIVEDEFISANAIKRTLQRAGYAVTGIAANERETMALLESDPPDLILMDIRLKGGENGVEIAQRLQKTQPLPIVFLTAYTDAETVESVYHLGAYGYLVKPFKDEKLVEAIALALQMHQ